MGQHETQYVAKINKRKAKNKNKVSTGTEQGAKHAMQILIMGQTPDKGNFVMYRVNFGTNVAN